MATPELDNWIDASYGYEDYSASGVIANASNIRFGSNPAYGIADFLLIYPTFGSVDSEGNYTGPLSQPVLQMFINLASASLSKERWFDFWEFAMALFIAHYASLYLQSLTPNNATAKKIASAGFAKGIQASKSVGDVSVSYQAITTGWESWGAWNLTVYGQQLMTQAAIVGLGGMYVW